MFSCCPRSNGAAFVSIRISPSSRSGHIRANSKAMNPPIDIPPRTHVSIPRSSRTCRQSFARSPRSYVSAQHVFDHAVGEVVLLRVAAQIRERQHRDRRLVGQRQARSRSSFRDTEGADSSILLGSRRLANERPEVPLARHALEFSQAPITELEA